MTAATKIKEYFDYFQQRKDVQVLYDLFDDDAVIEFPYQGEGFPSRLQGIDEIKKYYKDWKSTFYFDNMDIQITQVNEHHAIADVKATGKILVTNNPYNQHYFSFLHTSPITNKIIKYTEVFNPLSVIKSFTPLSSSS